MFLRENDGYNKKQVEKKVSELCHALEEKDKLNLGLAAALEKSKEIEASSQKLYELKVQKVLILFRNLEKSINTLFTLYPQIEEFDDIKKSFEKFAEAVENTFRLDDGKNINLAVNTDNDTFRLLLSKMSTYPSPASPKPRTASIKRKDSFHDNNIAKALGLNESTNGFESLAEKFLETGETEDNAYAKILSHSNQDFSPNESGFDLKEAVNPKDDLAEIMKAFNLD